MLQSIALLGFNSDASVNSDVRITIFPDVSAPLPQIPDTNGSNTLVQQPSTHFRSLAKSMALNIVFPMLICLIAHISQNSVTHESDSSDNEQLLAFTLKKLEWFPCGASDIYNGSKAIATLSDICIKAASNFLG